MSLENSEGKAYSPDISSYSFEGLSGVFGTLCSIVVAPIRILTRVMHNIFILPATMQESYAKTLLAVCCVMAAIGLVDLLLYHKWVMITAQVPLVFYALRLKGQAKRATLKAMEKREVEIDTNNIESMCSEIYDELDEIIKE